MAELGWRGLSPRWTDKKGAKDMADLSEVLLLCAFYSGVVLSSLILPKPQEARKKGPPTS